MKPVTKVCKVCGGGMKLRNRRTIVVRVPLTVKQVKIYQCSGCGHKQVLKEA